MPMYEYRCCECGREDTEVREVEMRNEPKICKKETLIETNDLEWKTTPKEPIRLFCNGGMKLKISRTSFTFKGK